ncbi:hypothetical protein GY45DRAFT_1258751 [Cubamyces sp. BRFM 1775]|nr:hypothetical protein GY45DRAFT_1258751 [Cubamyces sp. BRFM 1775]
MFRSVWNAPSCRSLSAGTWLNRSSLKFSHPYRPANPRSRPSLASCRLASTSANPYPFPTHAHPSPHQIFHLPKDATRADVKARYYDLVRIYHPDSPSARAGGISAETAHARFQAISSAYAVLSGKKHASSVDGSDEGFGAAGRPSYHDLSTAMWRARQRKRAEMDFGLDDRWKERLMMGAVLLVSPRKLCRTQYQQDVTESVQAIALFVLQTYTTRTQALSDARQSRRAASRERASLDSDDAHKLALEASSPTATSVQGPQRDP